MDPNLRVRTAPRRARATTWLVSVLAAVLAATGAVGAEEQLTAGFTLEQFDLQHYESGTTLAWDAVAHVGGDTWRGWLRVDGEDERPSALGLQNRLEVLLGRRLLGGREILAGVRVDSGDIPDRRYLALGLQSARGQALQWDSAVYVGHARRANSLVHVGGRLQARYAVPLGRTLALRLRAEGECWTEDHERGPEGAGSGPCEVRGGLRLGYTPRGGATWYAGIEARYQLQDTAELTRLVGGEPNRIGLVGGLRLEF